MSVIITMRGPVSNMDTMKEALAWYASQPKPPGLHSSRSYLKEGEENTMIFIEEWDDHDSYHKASDEIGPQFSERAKQDWDEWVTDAWTPSGAKAIE